MRKKWISKWKIGLHFKTLFLVLDFLKRYGKTLKKKKKSRFTFHQYLLTETKAVNHHYRPTEMHSMFMPDIHPRP